MVEKYLRQIEFTLYSKSGVALTIKDLTIEFQCEKNHEKTPNDGQFRIFNLNERNRGLFDSVGSRIEVKAIYLGTRPGGLLGTGFFSSKTLSTVFVGTITKVIHKISKTDVITEIEAADGLNRYRNARLEKGYPPNTDLKILFKDIGEKMALGNLLLNNIPSKNYASGLTLSGLCKDHLTMLCDSNGLEWSIQDENLQILNKKERIPGSGILIDEQNGMIGSPNKTKNGVEFQCYLEPALLPGREVFIKSRFINGSFKIRKVTHEGDNKSKSFISSCEANL
jgi:hypothetical protein